MSNPPPSKPRAFDLPDAAVNRSSGEKTNAKQGASPEPRPRALAVEDVTLTEEIVDTLDQTVALEKPEKRGIRWLSLFFTALGLLVSLSLGLAVDQLIRELFSRNEWLGWLGAAITATLVVAAAALILREIIGLWRLHRIDNLRTRAAAAFSDNAKALAETVERDIATLYDARADMAAARTALAAHRDDLLDGRGRITVTERFLLAPLDQRANALVMNAAKRVAVVTAVSPRALIDVVYVLAENIRLIRAMSELYGGRPGLIGFLGLMRKVISHLALTGAISIGDGLIQQVIGHGIAARLSARFGEGVVNGLLTARIGLAAHDVCRPIPFLATKRPSISIYLNALTGLAGRKESA